MLMWPLEADWESFAKWQMLVNPWMVKNCFVNQQRCAVNWSNKSQLCRCGPSCSLDSTGQLRVEGLSTLLAPPLFEEQMHYSWHPIPVAEIPSRLGKCHSSSRAAEPEPRSSSATGKATAQTPDLEEYKIYSRSSACGDWAPAQNSPCSILGLLVHWVSLSVFICKIRRFIFSIFNLLIIYLMLTKNKVL